MPVKTENEVSIIGSDRIEGGILLHFSEGTSVLYHAQFLYDVRDHDHNVPIVVDAEESSEQEG